MKVSHESPLCLLDKSVTYNDYDYCLVHLLDKYDQYKQFFHKMVEQKRHVLLDNSIFELGVSFDADKFAEKILELKPTEYVVPDVLEDMEGTILNFENWCKQHKNLPGRKIGVVQGKTLRDLLYCYNYMAKHADKIAISFDYSYYEVTGFCSFEKDNKWFRFLDGRRRFLVRLVSERLWCPKPHHLLGAALPQEFFFYNQLPLFDNIETIDTSNPIVAGILGVRYTPHGLDTKNTQKLADLLEVQLTEKQLEDIDFNVKYFKIINAI